MIPVASFAVLVLILPARVAKSNMPLPLRVIAPRVSVFVATVLFTLLNPPVTLSPLSTWVFVPVLEYVNVPVLPPITSVELALSEPVAVPLPRFRAPAVIVVLPV